MQRICNNMQDIFIIPNRRSHSGGKEILWEKVCPSRLPSPPRDLRDHTVKICRRRPERTVTEVVRLQCKLSYCRYSVFTSKVLKGSTWKLFREIFNQNCTSQSDYSDMYRLQHIFLFLFTIMLKVSLQNNDQQTMPKNMPKIFLM